MRRFTLFLGLLSVIVTTDAQTVIRGSITHLSAEWLRELREWRGCHVRFLARNTRCGRVTPISFDCRNISSAVYQHLGCAGAQDIAYFAVSGDDFGLRLEAVNIRVLSRRIPLVSVIGNVNTKRGGRSKPFGIRLARGNGDYCVFALRSSIPGVDSGLRYGDVDGLETYTRYSCGLGKQMGFIYKHLGEKSREDFIPFTVWFVDESSRKQRVEYDSIPVVISDSSQNAILQLSSSASLTLLVQQLSVTPVLPSTLSAVDEDDRNKDLVISFSSGFDPRVTGVVFSLNNPFPVYGDIVNVTQSEIDSGKVAYRPPVIDRPETMEFPFDVVDPSGSMISSKLTVQLIKRNEDIPYITVNNGLVVKRGGRGVINTNGLMVASNHDLAAVTLHVTHQPLAGRLTVVYKGVQGDASVMLVEDLENDRIFYESDKSVTIESDRVIFEVSDGVYSFQCFFPIWLYDMEPKISVLSTFTAHRNQAVMISSDVINVDCPGCDVMFTLDDGKLLKGRLYLRGGSDSIYVNTSESPDNLGQTGNTQLFTQADIVAGRVWYVPPRSKAIQAVSLTFNASTSSTWQVVSLKVKIIHSIDEGIRLANGVSLMLMVKEKSTTVLTSEAISFVSRHSNRADIKYVITDFPSFVSSKMDEENAGQIVWSSRLNEVAYEFSQEDIVKGRISYVAPVKDIGLKMLSVEFQFRVSDKTSVLFNQRFMIEIKPVDDMPPEVIQDEDITVEEDGSIVISSYHVRGEDMDTPTDQLQFRLLDVPHYGVLTHIDRELNLTIGDIFTMVDVNAQWILYHHTGRKVPRDQFDIKLSDGHHSVVATIPILIENFINDVPRLIESISYRVSIDVLRTRILVGQDSLLVFDPDTLDNTTMYTLKTSPQFGEMELRLHGVFETVTVFTQSDIIANRVYYRVINPQHLSANVTETLMFTVGEGRRTLDVEFEVDIVIPHNQVLSVVMASPFGVLEGSSQAIEAHHLSVSGATVRVHETSFIVRNYPHFGNLSVRGLTDMTVSSFTLMDIRLLQVTYIQTPHQGIEPSHDGFIFDVSDGLATLTGLLFDITIYPVNDELPVVIKGHPGPIVFRKENLTISPDLLRIVDADVGSTDTELSIQLTHMPQHGYLSILTKGNNLKRLKVRDLLTMNNFQNLKVIYTHDGSPSQRDLFNFSVSDGDHVVDDYLEIEISHPNIHKPVVINNTGLVLLQTIHEVPILSVNLSVRDKDSQPSELRYTIISLPAFGALQIQTHKSEKKLVTSLQTGSHFTQSNIDHGHVFYTHNGHSIGLVAFVFSVSDGRNEIRHLRFHITVKPVDTEPPVVVTNRGLTVKARTATVISPSVLKVKDNIAASSELTFQIINSTSVGFFSMVGNIDESINIFSQADVNASRVSFINSAGHSSSLFGIVVFSVSDRSNEININFVIQVTPDPAFLPKLVNEGMSAFSNEEKTLDSSSIALLGSNSPNEDILFTIISLPLYGHLTLSRGNNRKEILPSGGLFTQHDVINSRVRYKFLLQEGVIDKDLFIFRVFDPGYFNYTLLSDRQSRLQSSSSHQTFTISVITVDVKPPVVITNRGFGYLLVLESGKIGRPLSIHELQAGDDITDQSDLRYVVRDGPKHGELWYRWKRGVVNFRQKEINEGFIVYVLRDKDMAITRDSFSFSVKDKNRNVLKGQVFNISWVYLTMEPYRLQVRETDGTVNVTIRRIGNTDLWVSFTCKTESGTALEALPGIRLHEGKADFQPVSMLHTLAPGVMTTQCLIPLTDDSKYEGIEVFKVKVVHPVFAHLGDPSYVEITVVDPEDEPVFGFDTTNISVSEDVGDMELPVGRTGDLTDTLSVICYTESGSATGSTPPYLLTGDDYMTRTNSRLSKIVFEPGVSIKTCSVKILDDALEEGSEVFSMHLVTRGIGAKLDEKRADVYVTIEGPNDESTVQFSLPLYHVNESSGHVAITIQRIGPDISFPVSVWFTTKDEKPISARHGEDYIQLSRLVEFPPHSRQQTVKVRIMDDDVEEGQPVLEGLETFNVMLVSATRVGIGDLSEATVTIHDSEDTAVVGFSVSSVVTNEGPLLQLEVSRSGATNFLTNVRCYTQAGSAEKGTDFVDRPNTDMSIIKFEKGEISQKCYVVILDDDRLEGQETFTVLLDRPSDGARLGMAEVHVTITDPDDVPSIQFESVAMTVSEPFSPNERDSSILTLVLQRVGDLNMTSSVRSSTQDGSAQSGQDYKALSETITFKPFERRKTVGISVLFDLEKELGETFSVVLSLLPHSMNVQLGNKQRVSVTIANFAPSGVSFVLKPKVLSLLEYGKPLDGNSDVISGYPVICVSSCDPQFGNPKALDHCTKEMIDHSKTEYRWEVAESEAFSPLREVTFTSPFTNHSSVTLDSVYFKPGDRVRCYATPIDSKGVAGVEMASRIISVREQGFCYPGHPSQLDPGEIETQMRYMGIVDGPKSETVETLVRLPHIDGYIPLVSTHPLGSLALTLTIPSAQSGHACSNMVMGAEQKTVYGFIQPFIPGSEPTGPGFNYPHQFDARYRDIVSLSLYQYLDLEECRWTFRTWFTVSELLNSCGAQMSEGTGDITITTPLYISYVHFSASTVWRYLSDISRLVFSLSSTSLANPTGHTTQNMEEYTDWGQIYPSRMYIRQLDGKLEMHFLSVALFRGQFVMSHLNSAYLSHVEAPTDSVPFDLELLDTEPTVHRVKQRWRIVSEYSLPNYVGKYGLVLVPCKVARHVQWSTHFSQICTPSNPIEFFVRIDFQQTLSPQPVSYGLNTLFELLHNLQSFLRDPSLIQNPLELEANHYFRKGETIYGRAVVDPSQELREGFYLMIERVHLCAGRNGYVPSYDPANKHYGCLEPSIELSHRFKILDQDYPGTVDIAFHSVPFEAEFASDNSSYEMLTQQHSIDGFTLKVAPLFAATSGYSWYLQVVYSIKGSGNTMTRMRRDSLTAHNDNNTEPLAGLGTAIQEIRLFGGSEDQHKGEDKQPTQTALPAANKGGVMNNKSTALAITLGIVVPLICFLLIILLIVILRPQKRETANQSDDNTEKEKSTKSRKESGISIEHGANPYLASFLNVFSDNEKYDVDPFDSDEEEGSVTDGQTVDICDTDAYSVKSEDYSGDISDDDHTSYHSSHFKRFHIANGQWRANDDYVTTL